MSLNAKKAVAGLLRSLAAIAALLFIPAWSLRYWQGWVYLAIMGAASAAIILYLARHDDALIGRRLKVGPIAEKEKSQKIIQAFTSVAGIILILVPGFDYRWQWSHVPVALVSTGFVGVALGFIIMFLVFRENSFSSSIVEVAKDQTVVSTGPYAVVRHPMYVGAIVLFLATPLALGSWWAFIPAIILSAMIAVRLIDEERFLGRNLPGYDAYRSQVHYRLIPGLW
ncbi:isoprenylcysteine carboxylmethyltransferase family protein [Afipia massiliensis]|uniref:Isoprenylcysteine carboxylmethyltransferase family protein n=1 Tax=Afipia massiliensis TaxID=211460 RepID=A0A4U6BLB2_9BRAD|nr:isoprenylcysteine carboxylmethyltransferase family protein [Afipia massiliensis]TKT70611.1 isoprenylcysteine carboxylmethyltransferase family protein [Afipia massiliensis]